MAKNKTISLQPDNTDKSHISDVSTRTCSYCGGDEFETMASQYNDADGDYDKCTITYCVKCRNTYSIDL
jgi:DNA-directed RNA polymerase subunit M/transcription elongation factor TFIIS